MFHKVSALTLLGLLSLFQCPDADNDGVMDSEDNCISVPNEDQANQDLDEEGDACDAATYDFEDDTVGQRPADVTQDGGNDPTFVVRNVAGDRAVAYDGSTGVHDRFDRIDAWYPLQRYDLYVEAGDTDGEAVTLEMWSDGTAAERAGRGLQARVEPDGTFSVRRRIGDGFEEVGTTTLSDPLDFRLRLRKSTQSTSTLFVDTRNGDAFVQEADFEFDDTGLFGLGVTSAAEDGGRRPLLRITGNPQAPDAAVVVDRSPGYLTDWKLFQRGPLGTAPVPFRVAYRANVASRLDIRISDSETGTPLSGFDYGSHVYNLASAPEGLSYAGTIPGVPQGGNYDVEMRLTAAVSGNLLGVTGVSAIAVGDVFLAGGQSNMSGNSGTLGDVETPIDSVHLFGNDYRWQRGEEPMDSPANQTDLVSVDGGAAHSLMLRFAKDVSAQVGVPVAIIPSPVGGSSLFSQWSPDPDDRTNRGSLYGSALHRVLTQGYAHPIRGVIWFQGEADVGNTANLYAAYLQFVVDELRADLGNPDLFFGNCQLSVFAGPSDLDAWVAIQEAQRRQALSDEEPGPGGSAVIPTLDQPHPDGFHLTAEGYKAVGARLAAAVLRGSYGIAGPQGPQLSGAVFSAGSSQIDIQYNKQIAPGTGTDPTLYRVRDANGPVPVTAATPLNSTVRLTLGVPAVGDTFVSYGYSNDPGANWIDSIDGEGTALAFQDLPVN